ncbi:hypothetical protein G7070_11835 [Propioniciclava coleopterorum]|uniref:Uncharacterized protein n=1 Tax=Propioniciclava coleopterorum TaxID=2714937 RepID=A0A6G7Y859_9ACTN|nr:hypothetical protein [Propioniciclava coleopterorum]QIK72838.1 hypothetical protein G7070_11835 [Propioniciclava coleopterorum]
MQPDRREHLSALNPPLRIGERVGVLFTDTDGARTEALGFVTHVDADAVALVDRHGTERRLAWGDVEALRRVPISRGRRPDAAPRALLDDLADRTGAAGTPWVARISDLLAGRTPPEMVPAWGETAAFGGAAARFEGEWVTVAGGSPDDWVAAAWWATRMGARSVQVRLPGADDAPAASGFLRVG